jgi:hypothetical protein
MFVGVLVCLCFCVFVCWCQMSRPQLCTGHRQALYHQSQNQMSRAFFGNSSTVDLIAEAAQQKFQNSIGKNGILLTGGWVPLQSLFPKSDIACSPFPASLFGRFQFPVKGVGKFVLYSAVFRGFWWVGLDKNSQFSRRLAVNSRLTGKITPETRSLQTASRTTFFLKFQCLAAPPSCANIVSIS